MSQHIIGIEFRDAQSDDDGLVKTFQILQGSRQAMHCFGESRIGGNRRLIFRQRLALPSLRHRVEGRVVMIFGSVARGIVHAVSVTSVSAISGIYAILAHAAAILGKTCSPDCGFSGIRRAVTASPLGAAPICYGGSRPIAASRCKTSDFWNSGASCGASAPISSVSSLGRPKCSTTPAKNDPAAPNQPRSVWRGRPRPRGRKSFECCLTEAIACLPFYSTSRIEPKEDVEAGDRDEILISLRPLI